MKKFLTTITAVTLCLLAGAQEQTSAPVDSLAILKAKVKEMQAIINQLNKPIASMDKMYPEGKDTLDTGNEAIQVVLSQDGSYRFVKNPAVGASKDIFEKHWDEYSTNPYHIGLDQLPQRMTIWLVDSLSGYHHPYPQAQRVSSNYGPRWGKRHQGIDLPLTTGDPIYAAFDGRVRVSKVMNGYGNIVIIRHTNGLETFYGHLSSRKVEFGDWVSAGDVIGLGGSTGHSTGPHLHFETRYMGYAFDPQWVINFKTGELRHRLLVLRKQYFGDYCTFDQNWDDESFIEDKIKQIEAAQKAATAAQYYTVKSGDTLSKIAAKYHTNVSTLCKLNGMKSTSTLSIGKKLRVK
ncbi:MAG: peptidoglycan DD-metalloendopeptidase family protein [Bacteroidales bacterium]|nr:peptidoglycan DD-metalloendopeptidase family protein [Bacteroidales bacterium]